MRIHFSKATGYAIAIALALALSCSICVLSLDAATPEQQSAVALRQIRYVSRALDAQGRPLVGTVEMQFALYQNRTDQEPLWRETQKVQLDTQGKYNVQLGAATAGGLPVGLFSATEAHWLGVQVHGMVESPRIRLLSVPYTLMASDAQTLGGLPPSAFLRTDNSNGVASGDIFTPLVNGSALTPAATSPTRFPVTTTPSSSHAASSAMAVFDQAKDITQSQVVDTGTNIGIGLQSPQSKLEVNGTGIFRGNLNLTPFNPATSAAGSAPYLAQSGSSYNNSGVYQGSTLWQYLWEPLPLGNNTATPSAKLAVLGSFGSFSFSNKGLITFAPGQSIPGKYALKAPSDFVVTGSPIGSGTLGLDWAHPAHSFNTSNDVGPNSLVFRDFDGDISAKAILGTDIKIPYDGIKIYNHLIEVQGAGIPAVGAFNQYVGTDTSYGLRAQLGIGKLDGFDYLYGAGLQGTSSNSGQGVRGFSYASATYGGQGVWGESMGTWNSFYNGFGPDGVDGITHSPLGSGVAAINLGNGTGIYAQASSPGRAATFQGNVYVGGRISKGGGSFKIDDPLDPANKYLSHSFVESPDMMNIYNGNVTTNKDGEAIVEMPEWFQALNQDFRYNLTVMGQFAHAMVLRKIANNSFAIRTDKPEVEVSWQVTGIRHDAWANANRIPVEEAKSSQERGRYIHPELYGLRPENSIAARYQPGFTKVLSNRAIAEKPLLPTTDVPRREASSQ